MMLHQMCFWRGKIILQHVHQVCTLTPTLEARLPFSIIKQHWVSGSDCMQGMTLDSALHHVKTARPQAHPYVDCWKVSPRPFCLPPQSRL